MMYLGNAPGVKGWLFMHRPNNILFTAAQATFDETFFPRCPKAIRWPTTRLQTPAPPPNQCFKDRTCHCSPPGNEEEDKERFETPPQSPLPLLGKEREKPMNQKSHLPLLQKRKKNLKSVLPRPHQFLGPLGHKENIEYQLSQEMSMGSLDTLLTYWIGLGN